MSHHLLRLLFAAMFLLVGYATAAQLEIDTNRPGSDYRNFDLPAANPQLCAAYCEQDGRCRAFSYVKPGVQGPSARCWLKDQIPEPVRGDTRVISGVVRQAGPQRNPNFEYDTDRPGGDFRNFALPNANPDLCAAQCAQDGRCRAWTFVKPTAQHPAHCWLKDQIPNPVRGGTTAISGITRTGGPPPGPTPQPPVPPPQVQAPAPVGGATWVLKQIRVVNTMDGSVAAITRQQYDENGGSVEIQISGNILGGTCPGGFEKLGFTWRFERSVARIVHGGAVSANLAAGQITRSQNCGTQIASRSLIVLNPSSGTSSPLSAQEVQLVDGDRFLGGNGKRVRAAEANASEQPGIASIRVNTHLPLPQKPNAYFFVEAGTPTKTDSAVRFVYIYEKSGN